MHPRIDFDQYLLDWRKTFRPKIALRECTPRLLVVTDGSLSFSASSGFGLSQFVNRLKASVVHGMTPIVTTAHRSGTAADISNFEFKNSTFSIKKYDVLFLLGFSTATSDSNAMSEPERRVIAKFMQDGGGVFATGDHENLGGRLCGALPRVRSMRGWYDSAKPGFTDETRLSTVERGVNDIYEFADQSDAVLQRLYPSLQVEGQGVGGLQVHSLLKSPLGRIEVFPDHPHEGECFVPTVGAGIYEADGLEFEEWPAAADGERISPEAVAVSMSHGSAMGVKEALVPRSFIAICAYDGHTADVGRVVTDATWHHFVNINIDGTGAPGREGFMPGGVATSDGQKVFAYFQNLAEWLMPKKVRLCLKWRIISGLVKKFPFAEEINPRFRPRRLEDLAVMGASMQRTLTHAFGAEKAAEFADELVDLAMRPGLRVALTRSGASGARLATPDMVRHAVLGAMSSAVMRTEIDPDRVMKQVDGTARKTIRRTIKSIIERAHSDIELLRERLD